MNVVLLNPEIPFNTGNIGRTCVATGSMLHLVGKLGFKIEEKEIRRSGLDYWPKLSYRRYADFHSFLDCLPKDANLIFFSTKGLKNFRNAPYTKDCYLIFGQESSGFPYEIHRRFADSIYQIPIPGDVRSLNLSASAAVAVYEAARVAGLF
ncbi:MAG: tRNA (cytidine(34)-2'-O)-methyltransferase [Elusimicrobia bacterium]|nr:tRNA (cytidine(34)-2'-O)-methyltransferase [Elusimicrobiota bacterium]